MEETHALDKPPILGVVECKGQIRPVPMKDVAAKTVLRHLFKSFNLEDAEALYTNDYPAYNCLDSLCNHETINHSIGEYTRVKVHINTVEAEFSVFKPWNATFRGYSKEKTHLYTAHYNFLRNTRQMKRAERILAMLPPKNRSITGSKPSTRVNSPEPKYFSIPKPQKHPTKTKEVRKINH